MCSRKKLKFKTYLSIHCENSILVKNAIFTFSQNTAMNIDNHSASIVIEYRIQRPTVTTRIYWGLITLLCLIIVAFVSYQVYNTFLIKSSNVEFNQTTTTIPITTGTTKIPTTTTETTIKSITTKIPITTTRITETTIKSTTASTTTIPITTTTIKPTSESTTTIPKTTTTTTKKDTWNPIFDSI